MLVRRIFNHFELQEILGAGGMGAVYRALDTHLNRPVALKLLRTEHSQSLDLIQSLASEAAITASISHPHVVKVYSTGTDHGLFYIAMELVDKGSLDDLMGLQGKVPEPQVLEVGIQIAQGLNAAYKRGLIHRDVKPGNILFADAHTAKIVDFGLAVLQEHAGHVAGEVWGTPYYVAPEKLDTVGREDFRSDMYSLGATLFHAVAGRPPFEAETVSMVTLKHLKSQVVSLQTFAPQVSSATAYVINKTLHKDPDERYQSYEEFIEHLQYARTEFLEAQRDPKKKRRVVMGGDGEDQAQSWLTFGMVALIVGAGVLFFSFRDRWFGPPARQAESTAQVGEHLKVGADAQLIEARGKLVAGKYAEAASALRALDEQDIAPQPLKNWITMHAGLGYLLAGRAEDAQVEFQKIAERGIYTPDATEEKMASFFVNTAALAAGKAPIPATAAKDYDAKSYEGFALLLLAVKNWTLRAFDEAGPLFREFDSVTPPEAYSWISQFKPIASIYARDFASYRRVADTAGRAKTTDEKRQALEVIRTSRSGIKVRGALIEKIDEIESVLDKQLRADEEEKTKHEAELAAADAKAVAAAAAKIPPYLASYKFAEAAQVMAATPVASDKGKAEREAWMKRLDWLVKFKAYLITNVNTAGYPQPLLKRNGTVVPAGLHRANDLQAEVVTPYGPLPVPWPELTVESVTALAQAFLRTAPDAADRQWQLGVFLHTMGKKAEGTLLLQQAAQAKPEYQPHLALFPDTAAAP
ncbi:MAG: eukaryotic-like serine/threonine-protein kinase [Chthoniobacter sp.]|nr:eukaryotic-like serine/threonine-protein kinase [Chthoniobacter sp.]